MIEQRTLISSLPAKDKHLGISLIAFGLATEVATFLAQLGGHSEIHSRIAKYAMYAEALTTLAGVGILSSKDNTKRKTILKAIGLVGAGITTTAFISVPLTDTRIRSYFKKEKSDEDIQTVGELVNVMAFDLKRHLSSGAKHVLASYRNSL